MKSKTTTVTMRARISHQARNANDWSERLTGLGARFGSPTTLTVSTAGEIGTEIMVRPPLNAERAKAQFEEIAGEAIESMELTAHTAGGIKIRVTVRRAWGAGPIAGATVKVRATPDLARQIIEQVRAWPESKPGNLPSSRKGVVIMFLASGLASATAAATITPGAAGMMLGILLVASLTSIAVMVQEQAERRRHRAGAGLSVTEADTK